MNQADLLKESFKTLTTPNFLGTLMADDMTEPEPHPPFEKLAQPDVSVCIPSYNGGKTIRRAIRAALDQKGVKVEVVVCDDGSTDNTQAMADFDEGRVLVVVSPENRGAVPALNTAMDLASGRYLMFHGDDDWLAGGLAALVETLDAHPEYGFAYGGVQYWGRRSDYVLPQAFRKEDFYQHFACLDGFIFRREAWDKGLRWRDFQHRGALGDWDFVLQMIETLDYTGVRVDVPVLNYVLAWGRGWAAQQAAEAEMLAAFKHLWPQVTAETL